MVQAYSTIDIPKDVLAGDTVKDPKILVRIIRQVIGKPKYGKITTDMVIASIPETKSFVRVISMPTMTEEEAAEAIPWEAEAYIPMPISQVYLDWLILGPSLTEKDKMKVLITAAPRDYVDDYTNILKEAGLKPLALEVESQATARSLAPKASETVMIVDIDTVRTSLIIYERDTLQFTSSIPIAGNVFTESIAKALTISFVEAEKVKREYGLDESYNKGVIRRALAPALSNLVTEIQNTIRFYEEHAASPTDKINRLLLAGGSSKLKHLPSYLQEKFLKVAAESTLRSLPQFAVELGNPWIRVIQAGQTPPLSREDSLGYATAIGLALRERNK